jgi:GAF domain-containing protein
MDAISSVGELHRAVDLLAAAESIEEISNTLRSFARRLVGADGMALILRDGDLCHYFDEDAIGPLWKGKRFPMAACISGWAMLRRMTVSIADIAVDRRIPYELYQDTFVRSMVMVPFGQDSSVGALGAYWANIRAATEEEVLMVQALAQAAGGALQRLRHSLPSRSSDSDASSSAASA